jgi:hypothetical protein
MDEQRTLKWWAEDPSRLAAAELPAFWRDLSDDPAGWAAWGKKLTPLANIQDPYERENALFGLLRQEADNGDETAAEFLDAYGGSAASPMTRFGKGLWRGFSDGAITPAGSEVVNKLTGLVPRGYETGEWDDPATWGNIVGNVGGFVAGPAKIVRALGTVGKGAMFLGGHGALQGVGGHQLAENAKTAQRQEIEAAGGETPSFLEASPWSSPQALANIATQGTLSAVSGGLSGKVARTMEKGLPLGAGLRWQNRLAPIAEGGLSGAAQALDYSAGHLTELPSEALAMALGAPMAMGAAGAAVNHGQMRGYRPAPPAPIPTPIPTHGTPNYAPRPQGEAFPNLALVDPNVRKSIIAQGMLPKGLPRHLDNLEEMLAASAGHPSEAKVTLTSEADPNFKRQLLGVLSATQMEERGMSPRDYARFWTTRPQADPNAPPELEGFHTSNIRDEAMKYVFGIDLSGEQQRINLPAASYDLTLNHRLQVEYPDPNTGQPTQGIVVARPHRSEGANAAAPGAKYVLVSYRKPDGTVGAHFVDESSVTFPEIKPESDKLPGKIPNQRPTQRATIAGPEHAQAIDELVKRLQLNLPEPVASHPQAPSAPMQLFPEDDFSLPGIGPGEWKLKGPDWPLPRRR